MEVKMFKNMKISTKGILLAAALSFLLSVYLWFSGDKESGLFVGLWVPGILSFAVFMGAGINSK
jgi:hypothetical protein